MRHSRSIAFSFFFLSLFSQVAAQNQYLKKLVKNIPCFCITCKNLMMTLDEGLSKTCLLPVFSALLIEFKASAKTEVLVMANMLV
ncbi:hypothetical protein METSCH_E02230 [Metschnikowia aff. pulcherrima]|uniref:Uncharacterized protein n=1 Tax=Metschnikowia aff. pulcherrima TaxID=2163413 RepID=A0A4P6XU38_9ASCO|nr:hypothetical protein METSCH_E02230 [Metschnikowia aff. pulcherrima]